MIYATLDINVGEFVSRTRTSFDSVYALKRSLWQFYVNRVVKAEDYNVVTEYLSSAPDAIIKHNGSYYFTVDNKIYCAKSASEAMAIMNPSWRVMKIYPNGVTEIMPFYTQKKEKER